jgi:hypothetical protein
MKRDAVFIGIFSLIILVAISIISFSLPFTGDVVDTQNSPCLWSPYPGSSNTIQTQHDKLLEFPNYIETRLLCYHGRWYASTRGWEYFIYRDFNTGELRPERVNWGIIIVNPASEYFNDWKLVSGAEFGSGKLKWERETPEVPQPEPPENESETPEESDEANFIVQQIISPLGIGPTRRIADLDLENNLLLFSVTPRLETGADAYTYKFNTGNNKWEQAYHNNVDIHQNNVQYGYDVAFSGNAALITDPQYVSSQSFRGRVYIYKIDSQGKLNQVQVLTGDRNQRFGSKIEINKNISVIVRKMGLSGNSFDKDRLEVYEKDSSGKINLKKSFDFSFRDYNLGVDKISGVEENSFVVDLRNVSSSVKKIRFQFYRKLNNVWAQDRTIEFNEPANTNIRTFHTEGTFIYGNFRNVSNQEDLFPLKIMYRNQAGIWTGPFDLEGFVYPTNAITPKDNAFFFKHSNLWPGVELKEGVGYLYDINERRWNKILYKGLEYNYVKNSDVDGLRVAHDRANATIDMYRISIQ